MKKIHQIWITDNNEKPSDYVKLRMDTFKNLYSDYEYNLYNNEDLELIIKNNFEPKVLKAYQTIRPYAFKSDLARYCLLYLYGGIYSDVAIKHIERLEGDQPIIIESDQSRNNDGVKTIDNAPMYFPQSKHPALKTILNQCVDNILRHDYTNNPLKITGPGLLYTIDRTNITVGNTVYKDNKRYGKVDDKIIVEFKPDEYTSNYAKAGCIGTNEYESMWFDSNVFNMQLKEKKKFLIFTGMGDYDHDLCDWLDYKSDVYDRAVFYYGSNNKIYNQILEKNTEYFFKRKGMIWENFADHYRYFKDYDYVLIVDSDLKMNPKELEDTFEMASSNNWSACQWSRDKKSHGEFVPLYKQHEDKGIRQTLYIEMLFMMLRKDLCENLVKEWHELNLQYATGIDIILSNVGIRTKALPFYIIDKYKFYNPWPHDKKNGREVDSVTKTNGSTRMEKLVSIMRNNPKKYKIQNWKRFQCGNERLRWHNGIENTYLESYIK